MDEDELNGEIATLPMDWEIAMTILGGAVASRRERVMRSEKVSGRAVAMFVVIALVALVACGCTNDPQYTITYGRYVSEPTGEWIEVKPKTITFHVDIGREGHIFVTDELSYIIQRKGTEIMPQDGTTEDVLSGIGSFDWGLDAGTIVKKDGRTGKKVAVFKLKE